MLPGDPMVQISVTVRCSQNIILFQNKVSVVCVCVCIHMCVYVCQLSLLPLLYFLFEFQTLSCLHNIGCSTVAIAISFL